jgi:hypothetical protein
MLPSELYFCIIDGAICGEDDISDDGTILNVIVFCPIVYWETDKCLPDYYFSDQIDENLLPSNYSWLMCHEETMWCSKKSKEEIEKDLSDIGFTNNLEMQKFLIDCWE